MKPESIVLAVAGAFFGFIVGWVVGSQQAVPLRVPVAAAVAQPQAQAGPPPAQAQKPFDQAQAQSLEAQARKDPRDVQARVRLGNLYLDAERFDDAVTWYQEALKLDPNNPDVSTDLGVSFHLLNQPDRALQQFDVSLRIDPKNAKTMFNMGIVRAFGKQDLPGAVAVWQKLIEIAPKSPEADRARQAIEGLKSAHPGVVGTPPRGGTGSAGT